MNGTQILVDYMIEDGLGIILRPQLSKYSFANRLETLFGQTLSDF